MNTDFFPKITIIGLEYVGLPLAGLFATKYFDIDKTSIAELSNGVDTTLGMSAPLLKTVWVSEPSNNKGLFWTDDVDVIKTCNYLS
ncbi:hypothetical protein [Flavivirga sp. 57AJ16]|uniref:hypothetical protein n=1 Tax=Flavivirga sp. 57AJ16 TaxID=3025307 RepID=UPI002365C180|nr:hypothetical protein [Flavivirga sp. 57AJ16]MDD7886231.1 hypothetical protein [Flavivirga sp. 57AJ16]